MNLVRRDLRFDLNPDDVAPQCHVQVFPATSQAKTEMVAATASTVGVISIGALKVLAALALSPTLPSSTRARPQGRKFALADRSRRASGGRLSLAG